MDDPMNGSANPEGIVAQSLIAMCQFTCGNCHSVVVAKVPAMRVYNFPETSGVTIGHERLSKCPKCSAMYVPLIKGVDNDGKINFVWKQLPNPEGQQPAGQLKELESKPSFERSPVKGRKQ